MFLLFFVEALSEVEILMVQAFTLQHLHLEFELIIFFVNQPKSLLVIFVFFRHELNTAVEVKALVKVKGILVGFSKGPIDDRLSGKWIQIIPNDLNSSLLGQG